MSGSSNESHEPRQVFLSSDGLTIMVRPRNAADDLTSPPSPPVVPIGRGRRVPSTNDVSNSSPVGHGVGRGQRIPSPSHQPDQMSSNEPNSIIVGPEGFWILVRLTNNYVDDSTSPTNNSIDDSTSSSDNLFVGRGVGQGWNISSPSHQTSSARFGPSSTFVPSSNSLVRRVLSKSNA